MVLDRTRVIVINGRAITFETLRQNCKLHLFPDGYAELLWRSYWMKRDAGQDRTGALDELVRICFSESERRKLHGSTIEEK